MLLAKKDQACYNVILLYWWRETVSRYVRQLFFIALLTLCGCRADTFRHITIDADGQEIALSTDVLTVREALTEAKITIDTDDLVEPDLWVEIENEMIIRVIRVQEDTITEREVLPYGQQTIKSEAVPAGEQRLLQAGKNGQVQVTYRLQYHNGVEISRSVLQRIITIEPVPQITVVGVAGLVDSVDINGTIAYINSGNAWVMRGTSGGRHPVTTEGNLDGRVFALSPNAGCIKGMYVCAYRLGRSST